jgi:hypothetical protein
MRHARALPSVAGHQLPWRHRHLPGRVAALLPGVAAEVQRHLAAALPPVQVVVTTVRGFADLAIAADVELTGHHPPHPGRLRARLVREARDWQGYAAPTPRGALVLLNADHVAALPDPDLAVLLAHELVHCAQFFRPGALDLLRADALSRLGVARPTRREDRAAARRIAADETEAYAAEHPIAHAATTTAPRRLTWW